MTLLVSHHVVYDSYNSLCHITSGYAVVVAETRGRVPFYLMEW
uniref:Uncharacterized protein n=1 Tax=Rhizophora mucronata TaxID=61149 RepID=A0A2P2QB13_RHIMU